MSGLLEETLEEDSLKTQWKACYQIILTALKFRTALKFQRENYWVHIFQLKSQK